MNHKYINITPENLEGEHLCCAISDKKHQAGVSMKKEWMRERLKEGHVFRKLDAKGKVFIEYAPLEAAWVPIEGKNYMYIYCLWVSGSFKGQGCGQELLQYCIEDAKQQGKSGICILSASKKKPYLSDKKFMQKYGFESVGKVDDLYELLALSFDGTKPRFCESVKVSKIEKKTLVIYYSSQCPFICNSVKQIEDYCESKQIPHDLVFVDTLEKAKKLPCIFNNWGVFYNGKFEGVQLLNENALKKLLPDL